MAAANEIFAETEGVLAEELAVLESIYISEFSVEKDEQSWPHTVSVLLHPSTGMDHSKKYVCMTVNFGLSRSYPEEIPQISVSNPRGLGEEEIHSLVEDMKKLAEERKDGPMLYELIEMAKDCLTDGNLPHCECAICLEHFEEGDDFLKTDCYHYFHRACLASYATAFLAQLQKEEEDPSPLHVTKKEEKNLGCPMCRLPLTCDLADLMASPEQKDETVTFVPTTQLLQQQRRMAELYEKQKERGGIIDLEHERNKYLVDENTVVSLPSLKKDQETAAADNADASTTTSTAAATISLVKDSHPASTRGRGGGGGGSSYTSAARGRDNHRPHGGRSAPHRDPHHHHFDRNYHHHHQPRDDHGDRRDHRDYGDRRDHRDHGDRRDHREQHRDLGDRRDYRDHGDRRDHRDHDDRRDHGDRRDHRDHGDRRDHRDHGDRRDHRDLGDRRDHTDKRTDYHRDRGGPRGGGRDFRDDGRPHPRADGPNSRGVAGRQHHQQEEDFQADSRGKAGQGFQDDHGRSERRDGRWDPGQRHDRGCEAGGEILNSRPQAGHRERNGPGGNEKGQGRGHPRQDTRNSCHTKPTDKAETAANDGTGETASSKGEGRNSRGPEKGEDLNSDPARSERGGDRGHDYKRRGSDRHSHQGNRGAEQATQRNPGYHEGSGRHYYQGDRGADRATPRNPGYHESSGRHYYQGDRGADRATQRNPGYHEKGQQRYPDHRTHTRSGKSSPRGTALENGDGRSLPSLQNEHDGHCADSDQPSSALNSRHERAEGPGEQSFGRDGGGRRVGRRGRGGRGRDRPSESNWHNRNPAPKEGDVDTGPDKREDNGPAPRNDKRRQDNLDPEDRNMELEDRRRPDKNHSRHHHHHHGGRGRWKSSAHGDNPVKAEEMNGKSNDALPSNGGGFDQHKAAGKVKAVGSPRKGAPPGFHISGPPHKDSSTGPREEGAVVKPPPGFQSL